MKIRKPKGRGQSASILSLLRTLREASSATIGWIVLILAVVAGGVAMAASSWSPPSVPGVKTGEMLVRPAPKIDLFFAGPGNDPYGYWSRNQRLRESANYQRDLGEEVYKDFNQQRFIPDVILIPNQFNEGRVADLAFAVQFTICLQNNDDKPVIFELGEFLPLDPAVKDWRYALEQYGGMDTSTRPPKPIWEPVLVYDNSVFSSESSLVFSREPVAPGEVIILQFSISNKTGLGQNDRYIHDKLASLLQGGRRADLYLFTAQLHNTILVYPAVQKDHVKVDFFFDTKPDEQPGIYPASGFAYETSNYSDIGEAGVKVHFLDRGFWDSLLKKLGSSYEDFTNPERLSEIVPFKRQPTDPISDFQDIITDTGESLSAGTGAVPWWLSTYLKSRFPTSDAPYSQYTQPEASINRDLYNQFLETAAEVFEFGSPVLANRELRGYTSFKDSTIISVDHYHRDAFRKRFHLSLASWQDFTSLYWQLWGEVLKRLDLPSEASSRIVWWAGGQQLIPLTELVQQWPWVDVADYRAKYQAELDKLHQVVGTISQAVSEGTREEDLDTKESSAKGKSLLAWPTDSHYLNAYFEQEYPFGVHTGIDIEAEYGDAVYTAEAGTVLLVGYPDYTDSPLPSRVVIKHDNGLVTVYLHMGRVDVQAGDVVRRGETIGYIGGLPGTPGAGAFTTGPHLHFEVWEAGALSNPMLYLDSSKLPSGWLDWLVRLWGSIKDLLAAVFVR